MGVFMSGDWDVSPGWEAIEHPASFLGRVVDVMPASIAIVDGTGRIIGVNEAWRRFGEVNGLRDPQYCVGANYIRICERAQGINTEGSADVADNLRRLLEAKQECFQFLYPCHSPNEQRWFQEDGRAFTRGTEHFALITHHDVSHLKREGERASAELDRVLECMTDG